MVQKEAHRPEQRRPAMMFSEEQYRLAIGQLDKMIPWERARAACVAIMVKRGPRLQVKGTGTLFRIGQETFIVTAAHVVNNEERGQLYMFPFGGTIDDVLPLCGADNFDDRDHVDVAVTRLVPEVAEIIPSERCLRVSDVTFDKPSAESYFTVFGFPEFMCNQEAGQLRLINYHHAGPTYDGDPHTLEHHDPNLSIVISADGCETRGTDGKVVDLCYPGTNVSVRYPMELKGISGGAVWQIARHYGDVRRDAERARVVGIEVAICQSKRCIRATRWDVARAAIIDMVPELQPAFALVRL
jgi:hypothetical protein